MTLFLLLTVWYFGGCGLFIVTIRSIDPVITVKDLIMCAIAGLVGPVNLIWFFAYFNSAWLNKRIF